jgi:dihydrofolate synthase/folylpolyglutamate synthase
MPTYDQTIDYLFTRLPMFSRIGAAAYKGDLTNTLRLCAFCENPQQKFKTIHVAGTNGKGSVSHMLATTLQLAGYKTGLYTSPHLRDFRERIKINGEMVDRGFVVDFTEKIKPLIDEIEPSFFEITVAMAFDYFALQQVDIAVIEVGLGGRLDSTNVINPELSIITNIGWDHMNLLGDSLEKIAFEKAGIIKPGIPVVLGETLVQTKHLFEQVAREKGSVIHIASEKRQAVDWKWQKHELVVEIAEQHKVDHMIFHLDLPGIYQTRNLLTVLEACAQLVLKGWKIANETIVNALSRVKKLTGLHGRWEVIHNDPLLVLDVAHNVDGIRMLVQQLELLEPHHLHIVLGLVKDKDLENIIALLPKNASYYFTKAQIPRALPEHELAIKAEKAGLKGTTWEEVNEAIHAAMANAHKDDAIIVCGSVFLVGEVNLSE